jgi:hypothetical protein
MLSIVLPCVFSRLVFSLRLIYLGLSFPRFRIWFFQLNLSRFWWPSLPTGLSLPLWYCVCLGWPWSMQNACEA